MTEVTKEQAEVYYYRLLGLADALESGDYKQGQNSLHHGDEFCCLGVACDLAKIGEWKEYPDNPGLYYYITEHGRSGMLLPDDVKKYYGFPENAGLYPTGGASVHLAELNDGGVLFPVIAGHIRQFAREKYFDRT